MNRPGSGRIQKRTRWCFIEHNAEPVPFTTLAMRCYGTPKLPLKRRWQIYRALKVYGQPADRRGWWRANEALAKRIKGE